MCLARRSRVNEGHSFDPFGLVGTTIGGRYAIEALIGEGGFSVVYRARHVLWGRPVAIKAFRGFETLDSDAREALLRAFVQEGAILAELSERTTAIVQARDTATLFTAEGEWVPYLVLEWLDGETLEAVLWQESQAGLQPRNLEEATSLLEPIASALALAHAKGICHRDLKPGNVFVLGDSQGEIRTTKLLDFGMAAFFSDVFRKIPGWCPAEPGASAPGFDHAPQEPGACRPCGFTPLYGAPEQFSTSYGVTGPWTDVFALALIFVELLSGREPLGDGSPDELERVATDPACRPTPRTFGAAVSDEVEAVFARAVAVYPAERWQTAGSFWRALHEAMNAAHDEHQPQAPAPDPAPRPRLRFVPAAPVLLALALAVTTASDHPVRRFGSSSKVFAASGASSSSSGRTERPWAVVR